ncbi:MAG TPA: ABC transporter permease, partial [Thermoleophilia bacterium]|nr:ABC transporter permease [Thermoleophilia bacterium]
MALWKLTWTEIKLLVREPVTMLFTFAFPLFVLLVLGGIFRNERVTGGTFEDVLAMDYYVPGYIGLVIASIGMISLPVHLATYRERGVLRRFRASGLRELTYFGSQTVVAILIAVVGGLLVYLLGALVYDANQPDSLWRVLLTAIVGVATFAAIGILLAGLLPSARAVQGAGLLLWFTMMFLSGTASPLEFLPSWLLHVGQALPLYHLVQALQEPWNNGTMDWEELLITALYGAAA